LGQRRCLCHRCLDRTIEERKAQIAAFPAAHRADWVPRRVTFIENKTNYDEYIRTEKQHDELIVYHGGFISPKKRALFSKLALAAQSGIALRFWGDIDLGGFQMYEQLQKTFPNVRPMRMSAAEVEKYHHNGLARAEEYLYKLRTSHFNHDGSQFKSAIDKITEYGVTIEQEAFLAEYVPCDLACV